MRPRSHLDPLTQPLLQVWLAYVEPERQGTKRVFQVLSKLPSYPESNILRCLKLKHPVNDFFIVSRVAPDLLILETPEHYRRQLHNSPPRKDYHASIHPSAPP